MTVVSIINGMAHPIEVEGANLLPQFLKPGERREIIFAGATPSADEVAYFAYTVGEGGARNGGIEARRFRLARRGKQQEIWVVDNIRPPGK